MNVMWTRHSGRRSAMTLVEVVAGLALLAGVLTATLVVRAHMIRQMRTAERHRVALAAADELLSHWWQTPATFPRQASGPIERHPGLHWRTHLVANSGAARLDAQVVRLEIADAAAPADVPLASVELLVPRIEDR